MYSKCEEKAATVKSRFVIHAFGRQTVVFPGIYIADKKYTTLRRRDNTFSVSRNSDRRHHGLRLLIDFVREVGNYFAGVDIPYPDGSIC